MRKIKFFDFLGNIFTKKNQTISFETYRSTETSIKMQAYALFTVIDLIATLTAKCTFAVTDTDGELKKSDMWVLLNYKPNKNQNAFEFWHEVVAKMLYYGEVLILQKKDQLIIADSFVKEENVLIDSVFSEVKRGNFTFNGKYGSSKVLYFKLRNTDITALISGIYVLYEKLINTAAMKYYRSGKEKGILEVSSVARGAKDFNDKFDELMNNYFKSYFDSEKNAILPLFEGYKYNAGTAESTKKYSNEITDVEKLFQEALARAAQALKVPVSLVRGDVAGIKDSYNILLSNCVDPIAREISCGCSAAWYDFEDIAKGAGIKMQTKNIKHVDIFDIASGFDKLIASGAASINELREEVDYPRINEDWANEHFITKNYATAAGSQLEDNINYSEGGENNNAEVGDQTGSESE